MTKLYTINIPRDERDYDDGGWHGQVVRITVSSADFIYRWVRRLDETREALIPASWLVPHRPKCDACGGAMVRRMHPGNDHYEWECYCADWTFEDLRYDRGTN